MAVKTYKPITPGQRFKTTSSFEEITRTDPEKSLLAPLKKTGGRNNNGRITSRRRGGGHRKHYRIIDFKRDKPDIPADCAANTPTFHEIGHSAWSAPRYPRRAPVYFSKNQKLDGHQ